MSDNHDTSVIEGELLSVTTAKIEGKPVVLLTLRLEPEFSFDCHNLALSARQARRLLDDLTERFRESELLKDIEVSDTEAKDIFERIMESEVEEGDQDE